LSVSPPFGRRGSTAMRGGTGGVFPTTAAAVPAAPSTSPSLGTTFTSKRSPRATSVPGTSRPSPETGSGMPFFRQENR
jgi:hypothetical protein